MYYLLVANMKLGGDGDVEGGWHGNDTVWRMCLDLNRVLLYSNRKGHLCETPRRAVLSIADGIVAGEGDGPLKSDPRAMGIILGALQFRGCRLDFRVAHGLPAGANSDCEQRLYFAGLSPCGVRSGQHSLFAERRAG